MSQDGNQNGGNFGTNGDESGKGDDLDVLKLEMIALQVFFKTIITNFVVWKMSVIISLNLHIYLLSDISL
jgi:hypothetical protein